jgi:hypothetical protein
VSLTPLTTKKADFIVEYLFEYEAICKKALTRVSGAQIELFDEKIRGHQSRDRVPLTTQKGPHYPCDCDQIVKLAKDHAVWLTWIMS